MHSPRVYVEKHRAGGPGAYDAVIQGLDGTSVQLVFVSKGQKLKGDEPGVILIHVRHLEVFFESEKVLHFEADFDEFSGLSDCEFEWDPVNGEGYLQLDKGWRPKKSFSERLQGVFSRLKKEL